MKVIKLKKKEVLKLMHKANNINEEFVEVYNDFLDWVFVEKFVGLLCEQYNGLITELFKSKLYNLKLSVFAEEDEIIFEYGIEEFSGKKLDPENPIKTEGLTPAEIMLLNPTLKVMNGLNIENFFIGVSKNLFTNFVESIKAFEEYNKEFGLEATPENFKLHALVFLLNEDAIELEKSLNA